jgi:hypothetical protein
VSDLRPLPTDLRDYLRELTGNEYKVWTAYYFRTGDFDLTAHPSNRTIEQDTGLSNRTVKTSKAGLISKGWLSYTGDYKQPRHAEGTYAVPVMEVKLPWRPDWSAVVMDLNTAYNAFQTVVQDLPHGIVVQNLHPEGYGSGSIGLDSSFSSHRGRGASPPCSMSKDEIEAKSKPENLEPTPTPTPKPTPVMAMPKGSDGQVQKARYAPDGTPWPVLFNSWTNGERLNWLGAHGWKQDRAMETSSQKTPRSAVGQGKPTATATPLHNPPDSATPPTPRPDPYAYDPIRCRNGCSRRSYPVYMNKLCRSCFEAESERPSSIRTTAPLDNWDEV